MLENPVLPDPNQTEEERVNLKVAKEKTKEELELKERIVQEDKKAYI